MYRVCSWPSVCVFVYLHVCVWWLLRRGCSREPAGGAEWEEGRMGRKESPDPRSPWQGFAPPITLFGRGEEETMETSWPGPGARPSANNSQSWASPAMPQALLCVL